MIEKNELKGFPFFTWIKIWTICATLINDTLPIEFTTSLRAIILATILLHINSMCINWMPFNHEPLKAIDMNTYASWSWLEIVNQIFSSIAASFLYQIFPIDFFFPLNSPWILSELYCLFNSPITWTLFTSLTANIQFFSSSSSSSSRRCAF